MAHFGVRTAAAPRRLPAHGGSRTQTRGLTEGAVLAAIAAIAAAAGLVFPPAGVLLAPLPIMLLVLRWGIRTAVLAAVVAGLLLFQIFGPMLALSVVIVFGPLGLALGWGVRRGASAQLTVLLGAAALLAASLVTLGITSFLLHQDIVGELIRSEVHALQMTQSVVKRFNLPQQPRQAEELRQTIVMLPQLVRTVFPVLIALGGLIWAYLCYILARSVLRRVGHDIPAVPPMLAWRIPMTLATALLWAGGAVGVAALLWPGLAGTALNAMLVNLFTFAFQGALVGLVWLNARGVSRLLQVLCGLFLLTQGGFIVIMVLAVIGMFDTWYDFRRLRAAPAAVQTK